MIRFIFALFLIISPLLLLLPTTAFSAPAETRTMIGLVDTGIRPVAKFSQYLCKTGHRDFTGTGIVDRVGHGSNVFSLIAQNIDPKRNCIVVLKWYDTPQTSYGASQAMLQALRHALKLKVKFINLSAGGFGASDEEEKLTHDIIAARIHYTVAAGNEAINLDKWCITFPVCYVTQKSEFFHVVAASDAEGRLTNFSNYGSSVVTDIEPGVDQDAGSGTAMSGTSMAAANFTGKLVRKETPQWTPYSFRK